MWYIVVTREADTEIPSKGTSPFTPMGEITVDPKGVLKLLNNLNIHKASGPDGLSARVLKECSSEISPMLALIYNESLAQGTVPDDWRQANVAAVFKKGEKYNAANYSPLDDPGKKKFRCTPGGTKVVIYHLVGNFMLNSMQNVVSLATCAESL